LNCREKRKVGSIAFSAGKVVFFRNAGEGRKGKEDSVPEKARKMGIPPGLTRFGGGLGHLLILGKKFCPEWTRRGKRPSVEKKKGKKPLLCSRGLESKGKS